MITKLNGHSESWASERHIRHYDELNVFFPYILATRKITSEIASLTEQGEASAPIRILDAATGTGNIVLAVRKALQKIGGRFQITAFDSDERMLSRAKAKLEKSGNPENIRFCSGNLLSANFNLGKSLKQTFDVIVISNALFLFAEKDKKAILKKAYNLLAPNGTLILCEPREAQNSSPLKLLLQHVLHKSIVQLLFRMPAIIAISEENKKMQAETFMLSAEKQIALLKAAAFYVKKSGTTYGNRNIFLVCSKTNQAADIRDVSDHYIFLLKMLFTNLLRLGLVSLAVELVKLLAK